MKKIVFDPNENKGPVIVLIGRRDTGKSFLIRDLLYYHRDIPVGTVISGTEAGNGFYSSLVPKNFIFHEFKNILIENTLRRQKVALNQIKEDHATYGRTNIDPRTFIIMDDCLYDDKWTRERVMRLLFLNGRHWKIMLVISLQYVMGIPPLLRNNIDFVFILREPSIVTRKKIYENYASMFPTFEAFNTVMEQTTENYECLVIDNTTKSNKLNEQVFWYKANTHEQFRLGSQEFWDASANMRANDDDAYNPDDHRKRSSGPNITVKKTR